MNFYERIQLAIEKIEKTLTEAIEIKDLAAEAYMSQSTFYRLFLSMAGYNVKEYIRLRRISEASHELINSDITITQAAFKYAFGSSDSFSRAFRKITGASPIEFRKKGIYFEFHKIDVIEKYFLEGDESMKQNYPEIKIIREFPETKVAYFHSMGKEPEAKAFDSAKEWLNKENIRLSDYGMRVYGYNNPSPTGPDQEYGYEVCITLPENLEYSEDVNTKYLSNGLYAVQNVTRNGPEEIGYEIMKSWERFNRWIVGSKYIMGGHQWLEEHIGFDETNNHTGGVDLYMPIQLKYSSQSESTPTVRPETRVVAFVEKGVRAEWKARKTLSEWIETNQIDLTQEGYSIFATYNFQNIGKPSFVFKLYISLPEDVELPLNERIPETFPGGKYLKKQVKYMQNGASWYGFITEVQCSKEYEFSDLPFVEEYLITEMDINENTDVVQYMPVK